MSSKRKKSFSTSRHKYTTREIMDLTEQRRQKNDEAASKEAELRSKKPVPPIVEDIKTVAPEEIVPSVKEEVVKEEVVKEEPRVEQSEIEEVEEVKVEEVKVEDEKIEEVNVKGEIIEAIKSKSTIPPYAMGSLVYILILIAFLTLFSKLSVSWVNAVADKLNTVIIYGSFLILKMLGPCAIDGNVLNTHYYKISLQGDLVAFYSIELLIIFAVLFGLFQKMTRITKRTVFISLVPLAILANILRVVMACGLALNNGPACANWYFHGVLIGSVFVFVILGLILIEYLSSPES